MIPVEAVRTDPSGQTGGLGTALDHLQGIRPGQRPAGELVAPEDAGGPKQRAFGIGGQAGPLHVFIHPGLGRMVSGNDQVLAAA